MNALWKLLEKVSSFISCIHSFCTFIQFLFPLVLGSAVTPEIAAAWSKVVLYQARAFIEREADIYASVAAEGGWMGFKNFKVDNIKKETEFIISYTFSPIHAEPLPAFKYFFPL